MKMLNVQDLQLMKKWTEKKHVKSNLVQVEFGGVTT